MQLVVAVMYGFMIPRFGHLSLLERFPKSKENKQIVLYVPVPARGRLVEQREPRST